METLDSVRIPNGLEGKKAEEGVESKGAVFTNDRNGQVPRKILRIFEKKQKKSAESNKKAYTRNAQDHVGEISKMCTQIA